MSYQTIDILITSLIGIIAASFLLYWIFMPVRVKVERKPEYISPEKEYLSSEQINEIRAAAIKHYFPTMGSDNPEDVFEKLRKYKPADVPPGTVNKMPESKGHLLTWFDTDMGRVFEGIGNLGTFEVKQFNDAGEFIGIKVSQKFKYPAAYEKGYGGMIYPYEYIPPYLEVSKHYVSQFAGKTIADAAELVGNYGQREFVKPENVEQFACDLKTGFARAYKIPKGFLESK